MRALPGRLLVISDRRLAGVPLASLASLAAGLAAAGCPWLMLREKDLGLGDLLALVREVDNATREQSMALQVNGPPAAVLASPRAGLHLPAAGDPAAARAAIGPERLLGQSAHDADEIRRAAAAGADYATISPVFTPLSKDDTRPCLGLTGLAALTAASPIPLLALGGITAANAADCRAAGAAAVAVLGAVMAAADPVAALAPLLDAVG